jgi:hypothetical protein
MEASNRNVMPAVSNYNCTVISIFIQNDGCDSNIFILLHLLPLIEGGMVDYHTQKTKIIRDEVEGDIVVFRVW